MNIRDLGIKSYEDTLRIQSELVRERQDGEVSDTLILVEHEPVLTLGRLTGEEHILNKDFFTRNHIPIVQTDRGGSVTYHARGQLVIYPIMDLSRGKRDIGAYLDFFERTVVNSLHLFGIPAERMDQKRGVWLGGKKIAFLGIAVKKWVTSHGVSVNINNGLEPFSMINPCGDKDIRVTSVKEYTGREMDMAHAKSIFAKTFEKDFIAEYRCKKTVAYTLENSSG